MIAQKNVKEAVPCPPLLHGVMVKVTSRSASLSGLVTFIALPAFYFCGRCFFYILT